MDHHNNTIYEYRMMTLNRVNKLIYTLTALYRLLVSQLYDKRDCVASTGLAFETISPICQILDFSTTINIESNQSSGDDWDDDDDLLDDDDDDDEVEPDDKELEDEDQDDLDDDDDEEVF